MTKAFEGSTFWDYDLVAQQLMLKPVDTVKCKTLYLTCGGSRFSNALEVAALPTCCRRRRRTDMNFNSRHLADPELARANIRNVTNTGRNEVSNKYSAMPDSPKGKDCG